MAFFKPEKEILRVTYRDSKDRIAQFKRACNYRACRYLVYARPYLQHGVMLQVVLQESDIYDAPMSVRSLPGYEQVGFTHDWLLLSLDHHYISGFLDLDQEMRELWDIRLDLGTDKASSGLTVIAQPRGSIGSAPSRLVGEMGLFGLRSAQDGLCREYRLSVRVIYNVATQKSLMPTEVNPPIASSVKMSDEHRRVLRRAHLDLVQNLQLENSLLDFLYSESVLPPSLYETLTEETDRSKKVRPFLGQLPSLGPNAFHKFVTGLEKSGVDANVSVAKQLRRLEMQPQDG